MPHGEALTVTDPVAPAAGRRRPWHALRDRIGHLVQELGKFGTVGAIAFGVDTALFTWLNAGLDVEPLLSKTLATLVSASVAFVGNRFWTWRHRARSGLGQEYVRYFLLNVVGLAIALAVLSLSHYALGAIWPVLRTDTADLIAANVVGNALGTLFRFWSYRRFVFLLADSPQVARQPADPR